MAGTDSRFNSDRFKEAIHFAMQMAAPTQSAEGVIFRWETAKTFTQADPAGRPYSWAQAPASTTAHADVQIDCVVEFAARPAGSRDTPLGQFDTSRAIITVLDDDFPSIQGADLAIINGNTYEIQFVAPAIGLFDVTLYQLHLEARDES